MFSFFMTILFSNLFVSSFAYTPPSDFILQRTAENALRSPIAIEYEVTIKTPNHSTTIMEQWYIESPEKMRLRVSKGPQIEIVYQNNERSFLDRQGRKSQRISSEFLERPAFLASPESLRKFIQDLGVPANSLTGAPPLSRADGVVNYGFFQRTPEAVQVLNPGVWVEQDHFLPRQVRFKSGAQLNLSDYRPYGKTTMLPYQKTIRWKNSQAELRITRVIEKKKFAPQELTTLETTLDFGTMETELKQAVLEFYSRYR